MSGKYEALHLKGIYIFQRKKPSTHTYMTVVSPIIVGFRSECVDMIIPCQDVWFQNGENNTEGSSSSTTPGQAQLELSFEYLMSKDKLQWITISSEQAILMSVCLQAMVDELLLKKTGMKRKQVCSVY